MTVAGLGYAIQHIKQNARYPDTELAHVSPKEIQLFDYIQGKSVRNPKTGLPEYGLLGDLLQAALGVGGFMIGGPLGAAAGSGLGAAATGASAKNALLAAALGGVGGELGQGLTGGGWNPVGGTLGGGSAAAGAAQAAAMPSASVGVAGAGAAPELTQAQMAAEEAATVSPQEVANSAANLDQLPIGNATKGPGLGGLVSHIGGYGGLGAGLGAAMAPNYYSQSGTPTLGPPGLPAGAPTPLGWVNATTPGAQSNGPPGARATQPYPGDPLTYGQQGGEWPFFTQPNALARGGQPVHRAFGGGMRPPHVAVPHMSGSPLPLHRLRMMTGKSLMAEGGETSGPISGPGSGNADKIKTLLSDNEHVVTGREINALGEGSSAEGHKRMYRLRKMMLDQAGYKPSQHLKAHPKMSSDAALLKKAKSA